jgi:hypothetical protein
MISLQNELITVEVLNDQAELFFFLNSLTIRSVMTNPPNKLKAAMTSAHIPSILTTGVVLSVKSRIAPRIVIAEMAFVIDIKGVWRRGGTREIRKYPTRNEKMKTATAINKLVMKYILN